MPPSKSAKRRFSLWSKLALSAGGVIVALLISELIVRIAAPAWCDQWKMWRRDPIYVRGLRANVRDAAVHGLTGEFAFRFSTNAQGLRCDHDLVSPKPPGRVRCLVVGDSVTFGYGVDQGETFSDHAQRALDPPGDRIEVINAGFASGYTFDTEFLFTREVAGSWQPDVVVVGVCLSNDLSDLSTTRWNVADGKLVSAEKQNDWVPLWVKKSALVNLLVKGVAPRVVSWFKGGSGAGSTAAEPVARTESRPGAAPGLPSHPEPSGERAAPPSLPPAASSGSPQEKIAWVMKAWAHEAGLRGYRLVLMLIPDAAEVHAAAGEGALENIGEIRAVFLEEARKAAVAVVDPSEVLRDHRRRTGEDPYFKLDGHPNKTGHRVLGSWLAEILRPWMQR
jgi:hypothetical protein